MLIRTDLTIQRNIMNKLLLVAMTALCISCSPQTKTALTDAGICTETSCPIPKVKVVSPPIVDVISEDNWQFSLPDEGWISIEPVDTNIVAAFSNQKIGALVFLVKEKTKQSHSDYVFSTLGLIKSTTLKVLSAEQVHLGNADFTLITARDMTDTKNIRVWINVQDGCGYVFGCSVAVDVDAGNTTSICDQIFQTLQIK